MFHSGTVSAGPLFYFNCKVILKKPTPAFYINNRIFAGC